MLCSLWRLEGDEERRVGGNAWVCHGKGCVPLCGAVVLEALVADGSAMVHVVSQAFEVGEWG
jgi:hypothetical protein